MTTENRKKYMREYMKKIRTRSNKKIDLKKMSDDQRKEYFRNKTREYRLRNTEKLIEEKRKILDFDKISI